MQKDEIQNHNTGQDMKTEMLQEKLVKLRLK
jgi:hypothetical protein